MMPDNPGFKLALHSHGDPTHPDRIDRIPNKDDEQSSRAALDKFIPEANGPLLSQKICMYTHTPDKLPIVDRHPKFSRVILGGAFSGEGFKFSSVYGEIIADLVVKGKPEIPIEFMSFNRFAN
jgi:glycine/D-amino acid oxidase-like deaminating enzyme